MRRARPRDPTPAGRAGVSYVLGVDRGAKTHVAGDEEMGGSIIEWVAAHVTSV